MIQCTETRRRDEVTITQPMIILVAYLRTSSKPNLISKKGMS